ncbi:MAG: 16S rRNA (cytosine(1402)-N(4))-methyltransferase RsmH [Pseudomonadota bacterium]
MANRHETVLLHEAITSLVGSPGGFYVDGTYGRGGHSRCLLEQINEHGRVLACDKDGAAEDSALQLQEADPRFSFLRTSFADIPEYLAAQTKQADGILLDLGVSSPQLDQAERGFSFQSDGPLDMRMDQSGGMTAAEWLAVVDQEQLEQVLRDYGEERFARRIARAILEARDREPVARTAQLAEIVKAAHPRWEPGKHPATRAFQAIRIAINRELDDLKEFLGKALAALAIGGRLVVISFHSLEDRLVKRQFREWSKGPSLPKDIPLRAQDYQSKARILGKPVRPSAAELERNIRARSAIMRSAMRLA